MKCYHLLLCRRKTRGRNSASGACGLVSAALGLWSGGKGEAAQPLPPLVIYTELRAKQGNFIGILVSGMQILYLLIGKFDVSRLQ